MPTTAARSACSPSTGRAGFERGPADQAAPAIKVETRLRHSTVLYTPTAMTRDFIAASIPDKRKIASAHTSTGIIGDTAAPVRLDLFTAWPM